MMTPATGVCDGAFWFSLYNLHMVLSIRYLSSQTPVFQMPRLSIRGLGIRETMPACLIRRPQGTGDYLFMIFHDPVWFGPGDSPIPLERGVMVLWDRQAPHFYGNPHQPWCHSWIHCDGQRVAKALRTTSVKRNHPLHPVDPSRILRYLSDLHEEVMGRVAGDPVIVHHTLVNLIHAAARQKDDWPQMALPPELNRIKELIDRDYHKPMSLRQLAALAGMSGPYLCTEFRRCFGIPPMSYLLQRRLNTAATLLRTTDLPVGEIGRRVGYHDPYYFSKHFKNRFGVSPKQLRHSDKPA